MLGDSKNIRQPSVDSSIAEDIIEKSQRNGLKTVIITQCDNCRTEIILELAHKAQTLDKRRTWFLCSASCVDSHFSRKPVKAV